MKAVSRRGSTTPKRKRSSLFQRGYQPAREEKKRMDEQREQSGKRLFNLFLKDDGDEAQVRFLTEEPINFYAHTIKTVQGGKDHYETFACSQDDDCPYCDDGDRPSYKGAYLVYDKRTFETKDKNGKKKKIHGQIRLYIQGMRVIGQLDRLSSRYGLTKCDYIIARVGSGQNTSYTFDRVSDENEKITKKEIENLLPEKLRDMYDGTMESLYSIVEDQITMMLPGQSSNSSSSYSEDDEDDPDEDEDEEYELRRRRNLIGDDDDDDDDSDDEEEEDYSPKKSRHSVKGLSSKSGKSTKPSVHSGKNRKSVKRLYGR